MPARSTIDGNAIPPTRVVSPTSAWPTSPRTASAMASSPRLHGGRELRPRRLSPRAVLERDSLPSRCGRRRATKAVEDFDIRTPSIGTAGRIAVRRQPAEGHRRAGVRTGRQARASPRSRRAASMSGRSSTSTGESSSSAMPAWQSSSSAPSSTRSSPSATGSRSCTTARSSGGPARGGCDRREGRPADGRRPMKRNLPVSVAGSSGLVALASRRSSSSRRPTSRSGSRSSSPPPSSS